MRLIKSLALSFLTLIALKAHAIDQMYNWNGLEFVTSGNVTHVHPASPESTRLRGGWTLDISDVEPKAIANHDLPYKHKGGALAKIEVRPPIDSTKVAKVASGALAAGAAANLKPGNPYLMLAEVSCLFLCPLALEAISDWGAQKLKQNTDGSFSVLSPDPSSTPEFSDGYKYVVTWGGDHIALTPSAACSAVPNVISSVYDPRWGGYCDIKYLRSGDIVTSAAPSVRRLGPSECLIGQPVVNGVCNGEAVKETPLETYIQSNYTGKGWDHHWAKMTAAIVASGGNVFTDGTSTTITGPAIVPVSTSETKTPVSLIPGTTTPAPAGHAGPTESGTQTTTTTTTAHNKFNPAPMSSGSSGSPASGPSMETTQKTTTTTTITNNVTNITNIVNETTTEKDEAPEENATDTPLTGIPELYKQKYPDGISGVWNSFKTKFNQTPFVNLIHQLTPNIPSGGSCPAWTIDLSWTPGGSMGVYRLGDDYCFIWPILKIIIIITALFTARRLVFGG